MSAVKSGGLWKTINAAFVRSGGVWKPVAKAYYRSGGVWKQWLTAAVSGTYFGGGGGFSGQITRLATAAGIYTGSVSLNPDGEIYGGNYGGTPTWYTPFTPGIGNSHSVRFTKSGTGNFSGTPLGTWVALTTDRTCAVSNTSTGNQVFGHIFIDISTDGGASIIASASVNYLVGRDV
jgi:hypothetical protein